MKIEDIKVLRPFGPTIAKVKIPDNLVKKLNDYTDDVINNEQKKNNGKQGEDEEKRKNDWNMRNRMVEKFTKVYINAEHFLLP